MRDHPSPSPSPSPAWVAEERATIRALVAEASAEMLATLASPVMKAAGNVPKDDDLLAFIRITGRLRGFLAVAASPEFFRRSYPTHGLRRSQVVAVLDWAGEVANQLVGRIKRRFCDRGTDFDITVPVAGRVREIGALAPARDDEYGAAFALGRELVWVRFHVRPNESDKIFSDSAQPIECLPEGHIILF